MIFVNIAFIKFEIKLCMDLYVYLQRRILCKCVKYMRICADSYIKCTPVECNIFDHFTKICIVKSYLFTIAI